MFIALYQTFITALICIIKQTLSKTCPHKFSFPEANVFGMQTIKDVRFTHAIYYINKIIKIILF